MNAAHQLAAAMCASELVPAVYRGKPDNGAAAILYGAELGAPELQRMLEAGPDGRLARALALFSSSTSSEAMRQAAVDRMRAVETFPRRIGGG